MWRKLKAMYRGWRDYRWLKRSCAMSGFRVRVWDSGADRSAAIVSYEVHEDYISGAPTRLEACTALRAKVEARHALPAQVAAGDGR